MTPKDAAEHLRRLAEAGRLDALCERLHVDLLVVFGSAAIPEAERLAPPKDLDVAARFMHGAARDRLGLLGELVDVTSCDRVDLMDLSLAGDVARAAAFTPPTIPLYERVAGQHADAQMAALTTEMESRWLREMDLRLLAGE